MGVEHAGHGTRLFACGKESLRSRLVAILDLLGVTIADVVDADERQLRQTEPDELILVEIQQPEGDLRRRGEVAAGPFQNAVEGLMEFVETNVVKEGMGADGMFWSPLLLALFFFGRLRP